MATAPVPDPAADVVHAALRASPDGFAVLRVRAEPPRSRRSPRFEVVYANSAARHLLPDLVPGADLDPRASAHAALIDLLPVVRVGEVPLRGLRQLNTGATARSFDYAMAALDGDHVVVSFRDVGDATALNQQVQEAATMASRARRLLHVSLDCAPNAFTIYRIRRDDEGRARGFTIEFLNQSAVPPGRTVRDMVGLDLLAAEPTALATGIWAALVAAADDDQPHRLTLEQAPSGDEVPSFSQLILTRVDDDRIVMSRFDVTELKRAEREVAEARDVAVAASQAKSDFLATVTHEIRTPLTTIIGAADLLLGTGLDAEQRALVQRQRDSADVLLALVNDILDLSKVEAGRLELESVAFDVRDLIERAMGLVRSRAEEKGLDLFATIDSDVPPRVLGDPVRLQQVLLNLLSNAVKFTEGGEVVVHVACAAKDADGCLLRVAVTDTGIGLTDSAMARLFQPFVQADASTTRRYGGSGLGLSIARRIVERMGGELDVQSREGVGSRFWFTARFARAAEEPTPRREPLAGDPDPAIPGEQPHVLLAEDNDVNRLLVARMLQKVGCIVDTAADGTQAVSHALGSAYDLVLMDVRMPEMDGLEATRRIRQYEGAMHRRTVILALTANATSEALTATREAGMDGFLSKPVRLEALRAAVRLWCR